MISQKCQYALRAVFELARQAGQGPVKIGRIAEAQAIPVRFLEAILNQLKQGGFVNSRRGQEGGYFLVHDAGKLTVGQVIRFFEGPIGPVGCTDGKNKPRCPLWGSCVFLGMWERVGQAIAEVYDGTTFTDLLEQEKALTSAGCKIKSR
ncbi:MAG: Rrf2 family transcriptional regulator [Phycisphaerae bacterium]|nr:Rrf2 family transcriptional regulator [Phycisphaerae bacterium]